jgi:hypothetical protein
MKKIKDGTDLIKGEHTKLDLFGNKFRGPIKNNFFPEY